MSEQTFVFNVRFPRITPAGNVLWESIEVEAVSAVKAKWWVAVQSPFIKMARGWRGTIPVKLNDMQAKRVSK